MRYLVAASPCDPGDEDEDLAENDPEHANGADYDCRIEECRDYLEDVYTNS